jgi:hypothetical protein
MDGYVEFSTENLSGAGGQDAAVEETCLEFLGRWNRLVSTTNWEKGRIISQWRLSLVACGAPVQAYSDEVWSRRVGNVSSQHVGRLRRVHEQFAEVYAQYAGLYWSHFQAALDWHDAEMWLEGAVQNGWSVAQMRRQRWEATGAVPSEEPPDEETLPGELDEDAPPAEHLPDTMDASTREVHDAPSDDEGSPRETPDDPPFDAGGEIQDTVVSAATVRPFENLPPLPDDLREAFEAFKLAILAHKLTQWQNISRDDLLGVLDALKQLALAPADC